MATNALRHARASWPVLSLRSAALAATIGPVLALISLPLVVLLLSSLKPASALPFDDTALTLANYAAVYLEPATYRLLLNTLLYAAGSLGLGLLLGLTLAWLLERTDVPLKGLFATVLMVQMVIPPMIVAMSWVLLAGPGQGYLNLLLRQVLGVKGPGPLDIYTLWGMILVTAVAVVPTIFVMVSGMLRHLNASLEEASATSGASNARTWWHITLPLLRPGLLSVLVFFAVIMLEVFDIPLVIGLTVGFPVLSTRIYALTQTSQGAPEYGIASAFATIGVLLGVVLILLYVQLTARSERYATLTGKGFRPATLRLGWMRWPAFALLVLYFACAFALPLAVVLWNSLLPFAQAPSAEALRSVSLRSYWMVLTEDPRVMQIALNTLVLIVSTASICMGLGTLAAWLIVRSSPRVSRAVALATFLPTAFPSIIIALALLLGAVGTPLYGTVMLIVLGQVIRHLPLATRVMNVAQAQVGRELEEASAAAGATWQQTLKHVIIPLLRSPFTHGWLWVAMLSLRDVSIPLLLLSLQNPVAASLMWEYWSWGKLPEASASAILLLFLALVVGVPAQWQLRRGHTGV